MTSSTETRPNYSKRFFWFAVAIVVAIATYTAGWHYAANLLTDRVNTDIASLNGQGRRASCENAEARGYPFRIGIFCQSVMFEDARRGIGFRARHLRSAAQVYAPHRAIIELDGPATLQVPGLMALDLDWSSLRASARLATPLPDLLSLVSRDLVVSPDVLGDIAPALLLAESMELHMRPAGNDLDLASRFTRLVLDAELVGTDVLPAFNGLVDFQLTNGAIDIDLAGEGLRGRSGVLRTASISIDGGDAGATVQGPVAIDEAGLIDAELAVTLRDPRALADLLLAAMPEARREIELSLAGIIAMGDAPTLPVRIVKGDVSLGFFLLGSIPPL